MTATFKIPRSQGTRRGGQFQLSTHEAVSLTHSPCEVSSSAASSDHRTAAASTAAQCSAAKGTAAACPPLSSPSVNRVAPTPWMASTASSDPTATCGRGRIQDRHGYRRDGLGDGLEDENGP
eukprot:856717-Prorocentrum_minimum.AAC.2